MAFGLPSLTFSPISYLLRSVWQAHFVSAFSPFILKKDTLPSCVIQSESCLAWLESGHGFLPLPGEAPENIHCPLFLFEGANKIMEWVSLVSNI